MTDQINILLAKYVSGEANEMEKKQVEHWIAETPENEQYYIQIYDLWHLSVAQHTINFVDSGLAYQQFLTQNNLLHQHRSFWSGRGNGLLLKVAALVLLTAGLAYLAFFSRKTGVASRYYVSAKNISKRVVLPDSTVVWINENSSVSWDKDFGSSNRNVYLEGEGNFEINNHHSRIPFIVNTPGFTIRDIGTVFDIKAFSKDSAFEAFVVNGKISIEDRHQSGSQPVYLSKNELIKIAPALNRKEDDFQQRRSSISSRDIQQVSDVQPYLQWKEASLSFEAKGLPELLRLLSEKYNVEIVFNENELENYKYTGKFNSQMSIETLLEIIKETTPIHYEKSGQKILIKAK
ncbi:FecR family protein [Niabella soli]|uniref:Anti-FecI sigma factor FecR n=1 Tax=Niabella soli DSM 19437 TaxID=929713 RepID=W0F3X9_9BACT|nr:FecR family protein [Niabella soli]AHF17692.1 hypothetical protein NIASO_12400 [Niabella soli DSM 19437]